MRLVDSIVWLTEYTKGLKFYAAHLLLVLPLFMASTGQGELWAQGARGQEGVSPGGTSEKGTKPPSGKGDSQLAPFPIFFYTPETGVAFGGSFVYFDYADSAEKIPLTVSGVLFATQKKQLLSAFTFKDLWWNTFLFQSAVSFSYFPKKFFGTGSDVRQEDEETYLQQKLEVESSLQYRLFSSCFLGPLLRYGWGDIQDKEKGGLLASGRVPGSEGYELFGLGYRWELDRRDNPFFTRQGVFVKHTYLFHPRLDGRDFYFHEWEVDARFFYSLASAHVLAGQLYSEYVTPRAPFSYYPEMGGQKLLRGYYQGRYRDEFFAMAQLEYRWLLWRPFALVLFGGVGGVASSPAKLQKALPAGGLGARYFFDDKERISLRLDVAFGQNDQGFYITLLEAF
jgi:hypothetical protein